MELPPVERLDNSDDAIQTIMEQAKQKFLAEQEQANAETRRMQDEQRHKQDLCGASPSGHVYKHQGPNTYRCVGCGHLRIKTMDAGWLDL